MLHADIFSELRNLEKVMQITTLEGLWVQFVFPQLKWHFLLVVFSSVNFQQIVKEYFKKKLNVKYRSLP